jgi:glycosyltransferase involved in cell wall biosynthesis
MTSLLPNSNSTTSSQSQLDTEPRHLNSPASAPANARPETTIALLPWGDLFEDFFDTIGVSFETFRDEHMGSYMFGYINALKQVGVRTVLFFVSARVPTTLRFIHAPTGTQVCILPASRIYRAYRTLRRGARNASGVEENQKFSEVYTSDDTRSSLLLTLKDVAKSFGSYLSIPLGLLAEEIRREGCNVILCQEYEYPRFDTCVLLGKFMRLPVFATFQGGDAPQSFIENFWRSLVLKACNGLVIATQTEIDRVQSRYRVPSAKIARIFNPIDLSVWQAGDRQEARKALGIPPDARVVVCHGRIEIERKGLDVLLEAWQKLSSERPGRDLRLLLVGTGSDASKLRQRIAEMELRGVMWIDEFVRDRTIIQQYLSAADVYTLPSRHEGFPVAPLEAMACALPVVAADAPGVPDIFEQREASGGLVVPRGDAKALAVALKRVLDDEVIRHDMGKSARKRVEECFSLDAVGQQLRDIFFPELKDKLS